MHKVLVPVDGSDGALRAVRYAMKLARENGPVSIHLATAHEPPILYGEIEVYVGREKMERLQREHCEAILEPAAALLRAGGVPCTAEILVGEIAPSIVKRAQELGCDGIVMGTRGMSAIGNLVMGSVATKVVHLAAIPVTLVK
jgi:nucleotide-binding universal stress UspA family protein